MNQRIRKVIFYGFIVIFLIGCETIPKGFLRMPAEVVKKRALESRQYDTIDEGKILTSSAEVLQDLGFTLEESETKLGIIVGSKDRDATESGQVAGAVFLTFLSALGGSSSNALNEIDATQKIRACVVTNKALNGNSTVVRVTFQRIVWNRMGQINKMETLADEKLYVGFYEKLSKSIFLEANLI